MLLVLSHRNVEVRYNRSLQGVELTTEQAERLRRTLALLPAPHLRALQWIEIRQNPDYEGGSTNALRADWFRQRPGARQFFVVLDIDGFDPAQRSINALPNGYNYTLLHEVGHVVDWSFNAMRWIRRHDPEGYAAMLATPHSGETSGVSEHFADTYADYFFYPLSQRANDRRMEALLGSPAFTELETIPPRRD